MNTPHDFPLPIVHANSTPIKKLHDGYENAHQALEEFIKAYDAIDFNPRDYCPQGPDPWSTAWEEARNARMQRNTEIRRIRNYLQSHITHLALKRPQ